MCNLARDVLLVYMYMTTGGQERGVREGWRGEGGRGEEGRRKGGRK